MDKEYEMDGVGETTKTTRLLLAIQSGGQTVPGKRSVLVVDDDPDILDLLQLALEDAGYKVEVAAGGRAALESIRRMPPDLVLLDLFMPEVNGWEVIRQMRANPDMPEVPVVLLSAAADLSQTASQLGVCDFLPKPFALGELLARIRPCLARP